MDSRSVFEFAKMQQADVNEIAKLDADVLGADAFSERRFRFALGDPECSWHVLRCGGRIAGYCLVDTNADEQTASVLRICVERSRQGQNLGRLLMAKMIEQALASECLSIKLEVHEDNERAQRLYRSCGFVRNGITKRPYYDDGGRAVLMRLDLSKVDADEYTEERVADLLSALNASQPAARS